MVTGGSSSVNAITVPDHASASFSVTMSGGSATVEMTVDIPAGWEIDGRLL